MAIPRIQDAEIRVFNTFLSKSTNRLPGCTFAVMKSRITLLLIATVLTLSFSCKNANQPTSFGGPVDEKVAVPAAEAKNLLTDKPEATATLAGKVNEVCQAEGCWFNLDQGSGVALLVRMPEHSFTVPKDLSGKQVVVAGRLHYDTTDVATLREYAKEDGKSEEEINAINEPSVELVLEASGVKIQ